VPLLAEYTTADGPGSETVRLVAVDEHYIVNWHTNEFDLDEATTYRIRVLVDGTELGYADIDAVSSGRELKSVNTDQYIPLKDGRTLPIKFRIEVGAAQEPGLFTIAGPDDLAGLDTGVVSEPAVVDRQFVLVDLEEFNPSQEQVTFNVREAVFSASLDKVHLRSSDDYTWFGTVEGEPYGRVSLTERSGVLVGHLRLPSVIYAVRYVGGQVHSLLEVDPSQIPPDGPAIGGPQPSPRSSQGSGAAPGLARAVSQSDFFDPIDVMVLYTDDARIGEGSVAGIEAVIANAIDETNSAYENSLVDQRLRLVHAAEVDYVESGDSQTDLDCLQIPDDLCLDDIHSLRDSYGADIVSLVVGLLDDGTSGRAHLLKDISLEASDVGFSVTERFSWVKYTFAHELGHNMGCMHDRANSDQDGVFVYSYGYQHPGRFRTIMAYSCPGGCGTMPYFSNPDVLVNDDPTGVDPVVDLSHSAECARTLNETYATVGNWRWPPVTGAYLQGVVTEAGGVPTPGATVSIDALSIAALTNADGFYTLLGPLPPGPATYVVQAITPGLGVQSKSVILGPGPPKTANFVFPAPAPATLGRIQGVVMTGDLVPVFAEMSVVGTNLSAVPNADGFYFLPNVPTGKQHVTAIIPGTRQQGKTVWVEEGITTTVDFVFGQVVLTAGGGSTCGLPGTGAAYCWGSNTFAKLGDGSQIDRDVPTAVAGGHTFIALIPGGNHACGLDVRGVTYCWGLNSNGQLGDGTQTRRQVPSAVSGGHAFGALAAGRSHTCGVDDTGAAYCWGWNGFGQLGDGTQADQSVPTAVSGGHTFVALTAGNRHTCGLDAAGIAYCWGDNEDGQLGDGTQANQLVPSAVSGGHTFVALAAGNVHTCGVDDTGAAYCWGWNEFGQLGNRTLTNQPVPTAVSGGLAFGALTPGGGHTCGVDINGASYCWGYNEFGQLGDGSQIDRDVPTAVTGGHTFIALTAGSTHTCGDIGGAPYCWGRNDSGQLGDGTTDDQSIPTPVVNWPPL
jgi:alpha-tubulin suppressor-like RCC1 family protein